MMNREDRAKQFAPFEALTGLREALRQVELEEERIERKEVSEERAERISKTLNKIEKGKTVRATYYDKGYYIDVQGAVSAIDRTFKHIIIGEGKIYFDDLYELIII